MLPPELAQCFNCFQLRDFLTWWLWIFLHSNSPWASLQWIYLMSPGVCNFLAHAAFVGSLYQSWSVYQDLAHCHYQATVAMRWEHNSFPKKTNFLPQWWRELQTRIKGLTKTIHVPSGKMSVRGIALIYCMHYSSLFVREQHPKRCPASCWRAVRTVGQPQRVWAGTPAMQGAEPAPVTLSLEVLEGKA